MSATQVPGSPFGSLLRDYRLAAGLSQEELADRARLSVKTIGALERGERNSPYRDTIDLLAEALGLASMARRELEAAARRRRAPPTRDGLRGAPHIPLGEPPRRHNLPAETSRLIGRDDAIRAVAGLLESGRLVTLVGTGGIGKTRLAVSVAARSVERFADGAWLAELAAAEDAPGAVAAIAAAVGVIAGPGASPERALIDGLRTRRLLLVLDNCEHMVSSLARIGTQVLQGCPGVTILATSREPLRVRGERTWRVPALSLPTDDSLDALAAAESAALFRERALAGRPDLTIGAADAPALATICRRLDGLPLALELAAARAGMLSLTALAAALDDRFRVLTGGERGAAPRHQALRTTIAWSCDLLDVRERTLFGRLGIFVDGFALDAAVEICADDGLSEVQIFEALSSLVNKSLVVADIGVANTRYRMYESTLAFARELLAEAGEHVALASRHAAYFAGFVTAKGWEMWASPDPQTVADVTPELENIRAALRFTFDDGNDRVLGAQLIVGSAAMLRRLDRRLELEARIDALLAQHQLDPAVEAAANYEALYSMYAAPERQAAAGRRAVELLAQGGSPARLAHASALLAHNLAVCFGRYDAARPLIDTALQFARSRDDRDLLDQVLRLASQAFPPAATAERRQAGAESIALARASGIDRRVADALITAAEVEFADRAFDAALQLGREALEAQRRIANRTGLALQLTNVAAYALAAGDLETARASAREAIPLARAVDSRLAFLLAVQHLAGVALCADGDAERAAHLLGFVDAGLRAASFVREPTEQFGYDRDMAAVRAALGAARCAQALAAGALLTDDRAAREAGGAPAPGSGPGFMRS